MGCINRRTRANVDIVEQPEASLSSCMKKSWASDFSTVNQHNSRSRRLIGISQPWAGITNLHGHFLLVCTSTLAHLSHYCTQMGRIFLPTYHRGHKRSDSSTDLETMYKETLGTLVGMKARSKKTSCRNFPAVYE